MKRIKKLSVVFMVVVLTACSVFGVSADATFGNVYQIDNVTVIFDTDSQFSREQQEIISNLLVNPEYGLEQANLICNIFGHKNTTEGVTTITHKVFEESPRCLKELFTITICSRCNESTVDRDAYYYISCCPED